MTNTCAHTHTQTSDAAHKQNYLEAVCLDRNSRYTQGRQRHAHRKFIVSILYQQSQRHTLDVATHYQHLKVPISLGSLSVISVSEIKKKGSSVLQIVLFILVKNLGLYSEVSVTLSLFSFSNY